MRKPITDEDLLVRAAIDGRVAFATAAFATAAGLVALLDRVGAPARLVGILGPAIALSGLALVGLMVRTMRISRFYAGGRAMPPAYAGLAYGSLAGGLFLPFLPPVAGGPGFSFVLASFAGGLAMAAFIGGPLLRKTGAFSIPDLIAGRFPNLALRLGVVAVVAAVGFLIGLAGFEMAFEAFWRATGAGRAASLWLIGATLFMIGAPGGVSGVVWAAAGAAGVLMAGFGLPVGLALGRGASLPLPYVGDAAAWSAALARMAEWNREAGATQGVGAGVLMAILLGIGALGPMLAPAIATRDGAAARRAGLAGIFWCGVFAALAAASMAFSALAFDALAVGARPEQLPAAIYEASRAGLVAICGAHPGAAADARAVCAARGGFAGVLGASDIEASGRFLLLGLSDLRGLGGALGGLAAAGVVAIGLVFAAAGFHTLATALGHDAFYRVRDTTAMTSRRLAATRSILGVAIIAAGVVLAADTPDARALIGLAIVFSAATIAPLLALSIWPRATGSDAAAALLVGLAASEAMVTWFGGVGSLEAIGRAAAFACGASFVTGAIASLTHPFDPAGRGGAFLQGVLRGDNNLLTPDKGA